ncbi:Binding-protein-dependent transport system inner membrane component [Caprobacter fermentans]|uniref:Binding-protein-dependent transport system inner membrane component n=1 Tax=Caproicibacter fermentans TaxID=2576756 RepID=A0A6N8I2N0_9FIRM|nr:sugar ABC transporter permease [Caproicibacter fermentans]MVB12017.1 Binding-protein-dependent transport system inner membrane component [Caproicibacter fermentans]
MKKANRTDGRQNALPFWQWARGLRGQQMLVTITFLLVPLLLFFIFTCLPFLKMVQFSFFDMRYIGSRTFVGLDNYKSVFTRSDILSSLKLALYYLGASVIQLGLALLFASVLSFKTRLGSFFKGTLFFPYLVCGIAMGFIFKFFFTHGFVLDTVLTAIGVPHGILPMWLLNTNINNFSLAGSSIWRYTGQNMVLFIGAIMSVDPNLYEAAEIDGANGVNKFFHVILPSIKTIVVLNIILSVSGSISAFEPPYVITGGSFGTATYFVLMDQIAHLDQKVGLASAMAIVLLGIIIVVTVIQRLVFRLFLDEDEKGMTFRERRRSTRRIAVTASSKGGK